MNINQIRSMDYWTLVNMLMGQITPDTRKYILARLTEMNDKLIRDLETDKMAIHYEPLTLKKIYHESDSLDQKLEKIGVLQEKIIIEKRKRRAKSKDT